MVPKKQALSIQAYIMVSLKRHDKNLNFLGLFI